MPQYKWTLWMRQFNHLSKRQRLHLIQHTQTNQLLIVTCSSHSCPINFPLIFVKHKIRLGLEIKESQAQMYFTELSINSYLTDMDRCVLIHITSYRCSYPNIISTNDAKINFYLQELIFFTLYL